MYRKRWELIEHMKKHLSDVLLIGGLLSLGTGIYTEYGIGLSLIVCGALVIVMGVKLIPRVNK